MQLLGNLKIHFLALVLTVVAEFIGIKKLGPVVLLPLLYTLILGLLISIPKFKILRIKQMEKSADYIGIAVMILMVKVGLGIGPNLGILTSAGWALLLQELGHFFGTIVFGLPVALLVGMRREAVGAYLTAHGIAQDRLTPVGYGKERPKKIRKKLTEKYNWLKENDVLTEDFIKKLPKDKQEICNQLNRRTEFIVLRTTYGMFDEKGNLKQKPKPKTTQKSDDEYEIFIE